MVSRINSQTGSPLSVVGTRPGASAIVAIITGTFAVDGTITAMLPTGVTGTLQFTKTLKASPFTKSNIADAVANGVNTLSYVCSAADIPYNIGIDVSNAVSSTLGGGVSASAPGAPTIGTAIGITGGATVAVTPPASNGGVAITVYTAYALDSNGNVVATGSSATSPVTVSGLPDGTYTFKAAATNAAGLTGPLSGASNSVTLGGSAVAPAFTTGPTSLVAMSDNAITFTTGAATGSPAPTITNELMILGRPRPISTVLDETTRCSTNTFVNYVNVRQTATNASGTAVRVGVSLRQAGNAATDPRWSTGPFLKAIPQEGRPVVIGGIPAAGTGTMTYLSKGCVSETELPRARITQAEFNAAVAGAGTMAAPTSSIGNAMYTPTTAEVGKWVYAVCSATGTNGSIYFRTQGFQVRPAGVTTNVLRVATAGFNKVADFFFHNTGSVPLEMFQFVDVIVGSANHSQLKLALANLAIPDSVAAVGPGNTITALSACACYLNALQANCPSILVSGALPSLTDGQFDILSDALTAAAFGKTELIAGDHLTVKIRWSVPVGAKIPVCTGGDLWSGAQCWVYDPAQTTITNTTNGTVSGFTGVAPSNSMLSQSVGDGPPFDVLGLQVSGDFHADAGVGDSIFFGSNGKSMFVTSHYMCEDWGMPVTAAINLSRFGVTNSLFDSSAYLKSKIKYANRVFLELGTNSVGGVSLGNATVLQNNDITTVPIIRANAAESVAGLTALKVIRCALLLSFKSNNPDTSQFSAVSPETQTPAVRWDLGGDIATYYTPWCASQVGSLFDAFIDYSTALRLGTDPTKADYYKAQQVTYSYEAGQVLHPTISGGYYAGALMREQMLTL